MGTTPNFGFPYSELGESPNGPSQQEALAEAVDTTFAGIPSDIADHELRLVALETMPQPGQVVYVGRRVNAQSIANVANNDIATTILWDSTVWDPLGGVRDAVPNNDRLSPPVAGWYMFEGKGCTASTVGVPGDTNNVRDAGFKKNGVQIAGSAGRTPVVAYDGGPEAIGLIVESAPAITSMNGTTDFVQFWVKQASGGSLNTLVDNEYIPQVIVTYLGPL